MSTTVKQHEMYAEPGPTSASAIAFARKLVTLPRLRDAAGNPVRVMIHKLDIAEIAGLRAAFPGMFGSDPPAGETEQQRAERLKSRAAELARRTPAERAQSLKDFKLGANAMIIEAAEDPQFCSGREPQDGKAPVDALYDEDRGALYEEILRLSDMIEGGASEAEADNGGVAADRLAKFPDEGAGGSAAR